MQQLVKHWQLFFCVSIGNWPTIVISLIGKYLTSKLQVLVQHVATLSRAIMYDIIAVVHGLSGGASLRCPPKIFLKKINLHTYIKLSLYEKKLIYIHIY